MVEYSRDFVIAKAKKCFPEEDQEKVLEILNLYGEKSYEREQERVKLAILKLSEGDLEKLQSYVRAAKADYRDVLAWAEYPGELGTYPISDSEEVKKKREADRKQYTDWLNS